MKKENPILSKPEDKSTPPTVDELLTAAEKDIVLLETIQNAKQKMRVLKRRMEEIVKELQDPKNQELFEDSFREHDLREEFDRLGEEIDRAAAAFDKFTFEINLQAAEEKDRQKRKIN